MNPAVNPANMATNNPYKEDIDFAALALQDADFAKVYVKYHLKTVISLLKQPRACADHSLG